MENILGRSHDNQLLSTLFTDEKTANARARVVEWLNELSVTSESSTKCELLAKVQETIVGACVELLEEFLEPILSLAHDANMDVRRQVIGFMEQICKVKIDLLPQFINIIPMLLRDRSPQVIKRVIQACGSIYKNGFQWICGKTELTDSIEDTWNILSLMKAQVLDLIDNDNDGIRTNAIKFLEGIVVLQSYPDEDSQKKDNDFSLESVPENLKILKRKKLEEEAHNIFDILLQFHAATHISSVNLIACTGSLCTIAKLRPSYMGAVVDAFKKLNSNLPPTLTDSQVSSVRKSLKMQLMALLKNRGSFEYQSTLRHLLSDLGTSSSEIQRALPKMDKQEQARRQKRLLESAANNLNKRIRLSDQLEKEGSQAVDKRSGSNSSSSAADSQHQQPMEIDEEELEKQRQKSTRVNEKFITENLRSTETAINLVIEFLSKLPDTVPTHFLNDYTPISDMTIQQQVGKIARALGEQMTAVKIGPGAAVFSRDPPMRPAARPKTPPPTQQQQQQQTKSKPHAVEPMEVVIEKGKATIASTVASTTTTTSSTTTSQTSNNDDQMRKEEATKKLRENMERMKGEQELIERMKERAKTLKLQEVTKPFSRQMKEKFLLDSVKRILHSERQCIAGGVSAKRRKILTVIAATFPDNVRYFIFDFIMEDIRHRFDLAFSWLYEEYCLLQGFTRHSYVKSENRPDHAYNELLTQLITGISKNCDLKDRILLLRRLYLEAPILSEDSINQLLQMCQQQEYAQHCLDLIKDLAVLRPPRKNKFLRILLNYCVHDSPELRTRALEHLVTLYNVHKILPNRIEEFAYEWLNYLNKETPPANIYAEVYGRSDVAATSWNESIVKICLNPILYLLPHKPNVFLEKLMQTYIATAQENKRHILRSIDPPIKKLGADNVELLDLISNFPKGTETLVIRMIYILTERVSTPSNELMQRVRGLYSNKLKDVRVIIPVLHGLTRSEIIAALPNLIKLNPVVVKEVFNRLFGIGSEFSNQTVATTPTDILVALHKIDANNMDLKFVLKATSLCLAEKDVFTQEVLVATLQQLVEVVPLPTLLMRTIIQSLTLYPKMTNFVLNLLQRLILKQVWRYKVIWDGFLKCCQRLKPQSLPVLLQLPPQYLKSSLQQCPDLRAPLLEYAESIQDEPMSGITTQIMDIITGKAVDVFITDESGGYISVENIKKEIEEPQEMSDISPVSVIGPPPVPAPVPPPTGNSNQPLPPGEED